MLSSSPPHSIHPIFLAFLLRYDLCSCLCRSARPSLDSCVMCLFSLLAWGRSWCRDRNRGGGRWTRGETLYVMLFACQVSLDGQDCFNECWTMRWDESFFLPLCFYLLDVLWCLCLQRWLLTRQCKRTKRFWNSENELLNQIIQVRTVGIFKRGNYCVQGYQNMNIRMYNFEISCENFNLSKMIYVYYQRKWLQVNFRVISHSKPVTQE